MDKVQKIVVLGIIENEKWEILITQRLDPKISNAHMKWDIPWWKNEFGESLEDTLTREIYEETWLNIEITQFLPKSLSKFWEHEEYHQHTLLFCYICKLTGWDLHLNDPKIQDIKWINPKSDLYEFDFLETTFDFIKFYLQNK